MATGSRKLGLFLGYIKRTKAISGGPPPPPDMTRITRSGAIRITRTGDKRVTR